MKADVFMRNLFALADRKRCFLEDLGHLTIDEVSGWIAFYQLESEEMEERVNARR